MKYKTTDGYIHETVEAAGRHQSDRVCNLLDHSIGQIINQSGTITRSDIRDIIELLAGDYEKSRRLQSHLNSILGEDDQIEEEEA